MPEQLSQLVVPLALVALFWFLVIRPQQTRMKKQREMQAALAVGDEVMLHSGIFGTIVSLGERLTLRVVGGTEIEVIPDAVSRVSRSAAELADEMPATEADGDAATEDENA